MALSSALSTFWTYGFLVFDESLLSFNHTLVIKDSAHPEGVSKPSHALPYKP